MKVELIGTGAIYTRYNSACTLVNDDMIIDFPNGTLKQLLKTNHNPNKIDKIVVTHFHGDHTADIPFLLMYKLKSKEEVNITTVIGPIGVETKVKQLFEAFNYSFEKIEDKVKFVELNPNEITNIGYKIEAVQVLHKKEKPAYGYIIDGKIGFTGDSALCDGIEHIFSKSSDIVIADCSHIDGNLNHMGIDNLAYLLEKYNKKIVATHIRDYTREILKKINYPDILVVEDGYKFEI